MAAKRIIFGKDAKSLVIDTCENYGIGQYFYIKEDGADGTDNEYERGICMKVTISRINYKKTIYKPGYANVEMTIDNFSSFQEKKYVDALRVYFLFGQRTLELKNSKLESTKQKYIEGYYITDLALKQKLINGSRVTIVVLKAYSPDYFLTLNKYSKAYRGKPLSKIIEETLTSTFSGDASILKSRFYHANLCHTTESTNPSNELKQPYLVQYNESFHDFVVRTANRCGELFYYEDGKLILGVDGSNIMNDDNKSILVRSIKGALPEDMVFSSIPSPFIKEVKPIDKSYMNNQKIMDKAKGDGLFCNRNIESVDTLRTVTNNDSLKLSKLIECHGMEVGNKMLGAGGLLDFFTAGISKAEDIAITAAMMHKGVLLPDKSKVTLQDCELELNNLYHSNVTGKESKAVEAFKKVYMEEHPEEFCKYETKPYDPFTESTSKASQELVHYLEEVLMATRDHKEVWKKTYREDHPDMFHKEVTLDDTDIFAAGTKGKELLDKFIADNTIKIADDQEQIDNFKKNYIDGRGKEYFTDSFNPLEDSIWYDPTSQPWNDLKAALSPGGLPPTNADIAKEKQRIKKNYPGLCKKAEPMTEKEVKALFDDTTSQYRKDYEEYMLRFGNNRDQILKTKKAIETNTGECKDFFEEIKNEWQKEHSKENRAFPESLFDDAWKESIGHPHDSKKNPPYNAITKRFKENYKSDPKHKSEFQITVTIKDTSDAKWAKGTAAEKALTAYLENKKNNANFSNAFYTWIEAVEKLNTESIQVHRLSDKKIPEYKLAQYYTLDSTADSQVYLINQVEVDIYAESTGQKTSSTAEATPVYKVDASITISKTELNKARLEKYGYMNSTFPPLAEIPHIRKSEPQIAYVTDNADPLRAGRVQIRYPWMTDEPDPVNAKGDVINSVKKKPAAPQYSPWIPVLVPFVGGEESGFLMTPDTKDIVMINYEGGNIERPYVDGSLFCGAGSTYWGKTPLIPKANDFRGSKHVISYKGNGISFVPGSADAFSLGLLPSVITGPIMKAIGNIDENSDKTPGWKKGLKNTFNNNMKIGGSIVLSDHYGMYNISMSSASRSIDIESPWGNVNLNAFSGITISAPNGDIKIAGKNVTIEAGNNIKMVSGKNIKSKHADWGMEIGNAAAQIAGAAAGAALKYTIKNTLAIDMGKALDLSFVRSVWEIICRPVEGSLSMNSKRNVILEAGGSKADIPAETLSSTPMAKKGFKISSWTAIKSAIAPLSNAQDIAKEKAAEEAPMHKLEQLAVNYFNAIDTGLESLGASTKTLSSKWQFMTKVCLSLPGEDNSMSIIKDGYNDPQSLIKTIIGAKKLDYNNEKAKLNEWLALPPHSDNALKENASIFWGQFKLSAFIDNFNALVDLWSNIKTTLADDATNALLKKLKEHNTPKVTLVKNAYGFDQDTMDNVIPEAIATKENIMKALSLSNLEEAQMFEIITNETSFGDKRQTAAKILKRLAYNQIVTKSDRYIVTKKDPVTGKKTEAEKSVLPIDDLKDNAKWLEYTDSIDMKKSTATKIQSVASTFLKSAGLGDLASYDDSDDSWSFANSLQQTFNINGKSGPRALWDVSTKRGMILMAGSNGSTKVLGMKESDNFESFKSNKTNGFKKAFKNIKE